MADDTARTGLRVLSQLWTVGIAAAQWLALRLQSIAAVVITLVALLAVLGHEGLLPFAVSDGKFAASKQHNSPYISNSVALRPMCGLGLCYLCILWHFLCTDHASSIHYLCHTCVLPVHYLCIACALPVLCPSQAVIDATRLGPFTVRPRASLLTVSAGDTDRGL